jgi:hypothetical protein
VGVWTVNMRRKAFSMYCVSQKAWIGFFFFFAQNRIWNFKIFYNFIFFITLKFLILQFLRPTHQHPPWCWRRHALLCCNKETQGSKHMRVSTWEILEWAHERFANEQIKHLRVSAGGIQYQVLNLLTHLSIVDTPLPWFLPFRLSLFKDVGISFYLPPFVSKSNGVTCFDTPKQL